MSQFLKTRRLAAWVVVVSAALLSAGCGGGNSAPKNEKGSSGFAVDGYLKDSTVLCDSNGNGSADTGEINVITNSGGGFTFLPACTAPMVLMGGVSTDTNLAFIGKLKAPAGSKLITPLTTLMAEGLTQAEIISALGLPAGTDVLNTDPAYAPSGVLVNDRLMKVTAATQLSVQKSTEIIAALAGGASAADKQAIYNEVMVALVAQLKASSTSLIAGAVIDQAIVAKLVEAASTRIAQSSNVSAAIKAAASSVNPASLGEVVAGGMKFQMEALLGAGQGLTAETVAQSNDAKITTFVMANQLALVGPPSTTITTLGTTLTSQFINPPPPPPVVSTGLPITFDDVTVTYTLTDFGGNAGSVVIDPAGGTNKVAKMIKGAAGAPSEVWAGTTISTGANNSIATIPLAVGATSMTMRVWSPAAGLPIRLKLEDAADGTKTVETEAVTTAANAWQTLTFNFANQSTGTAVLNTAITFNKASVFANFGTAESGVTYYFDDLALSAATPPPPPVVISSLPITFDDSAVTYTLTDFGGNAGSVVVDPAGGTNKVAKLIKGIAGVPSESWAGTTISTGANNSIATIPLAVGATSMTMRVWSPAAGLPIRLKLEDAADGTKTVETEAVTTAANAWQTLTFNFANQSTGTAVLNTAITFNKASVFANFGTAESGVTYYFDDLALSAATPPPPPVVISSLPITFDDSAVTYTLTDFGGNAGSVVVDPAGGTNKVAKLIKGIVGTPSETWAGTTISTGANSSIATVPLATGAMTMSLRVWSPAAGLPIRLKLEDAADATKSVETEAVTTAANAWQTLVFNFASQAGGTAAFNSTYTYNKASVFANFNIAQSGVTYYFDDLALGGVAPPPVAATAPTVAAPMPALAAANVLSIYSDAYPQIAGVNLNPGWGQSTAVTEVLVAGNNTQKYTTLNYQGIDFAANAIDVTGKTKLHIDVWSQDLGSLQLSLISGGPLENATTLTLTAGQWNSFDIDLSLYTVPNKAAIIQVKFDVQPASGTLYYDNLYFW